MAYTELVCVMTVNPGYAGQRLIPRTIDKLRKLAGIVATEYPGVQIEVDGNVSWRNITVMIEAGCTV